MTAFVGPICFKACTKCGESKPLEGFQRASRKFGRRPNCKACVSTTGEAWRAANPDKVKANKAWHGANPERAAAKNKAYSAANPEKMRAYTKARHAANPDQLAAFSKAWKVANPEKVRANSRVRGKAWHVANPAIRAAQTSRRRASKHQATPDWADHLKIAEIFKVAGAAAREVDHIYPLKGRTVSGLHVEANLRPLCGSVNARKNNKLPGFLADELWNPTGPDVYHEAGQ